VLVAASARAQLPEAGRALGITATPTDPTVTLHVGDTARFRAQAAGVDLIWRWTLDGRAVGGSRQWTFVPTVDDVGAHELVVGVTGPAGTARRVWNVRVEPPRPPTIASATPAAESFAAQVGKTVVFRVRAQAGLPDESIAIAWSVDGAPAGSGDTFRWRASAPGVVRVRVLVTGALGAAVAREWRVTVTVPTTTTTVTTTTRAPTTSTTHPSATTSTTVLPPATTTTRPPPRPVAPPTTAPPSPSATLDEASVRTFMERWAAAWSAHDIAELRRLGQVTSDAQARALESYFARTPELQVQVEIRDVTIEGDRATVRFRRRDRFRDPAGQLVTQTSPTLEKEVVRGPHGLRLAPAE
jgi:hypothetical protein